VNASAARPQPKAAFFKAAALSLSLVLWATWVTAGGQPYVATPDTTCHTQLTAYRTSPNVASRSVLMACTDSVDSVYRVTTLNRTDAEASRLVKMFFDVPEYHDEGRLAAGNDSSGRPVLGPFAGIYASPFLHGFTRPAQIFEQGPRGTLAAIVIVEPRLGETIPATYSNLFLSAGMNCVWLAVDPPTRAVRNARDSSYRLHLVYHAYVAHARSDTGICDRTVTAPELPVVAVTINHFDVDSVYQPVARFDTDANGNLLLGFRCLNAFCEVGAKEPAAVRTPDGLTRIPGPPEPQWRSGGPTQDQRRAVIKAWHDEQTLAIRDAAFYWRPSDVRATIRPVSEAATLDSADFIGKWVDVAKIEIRGEVPRESKYFGWGLRHGTNVVQFRHDPTDNRNAWKARIISDSTFGRPITTRWPHMKRTVHFDVTVPPVVRFRWTGADDGVWAPCGNACCQAAGQ
jgi:hypothetical protein